MKFSISEIASQIKEFYKKLGKKKIVIIITTLGIVIAGAILISLIINSGKYSRLYSGLSTNEAAEIYSVLEDMAVDVKVKDENTILVPTDQVATLKMQLAVQGYPKSSLSYDIFTEQSSLLTTDYEKKQLLVFQLQERIQESIKTLQGVKDVIVTLSIPEDNSYVLKDDEVPATASVILKMNGTLSLSAGQINGIENLVANSVTGLSNDNVVIIDGEGVQLNSKDKGVFGTDNAYVKVQTVNIINDIYEKKVRDFLKPILGENGMSIAVNTVVDFDVISSEETIYTPVIGENGIISWVERSGKTVNDDNSNKNPPVYNETSDTDTSDEASIENDENKISSSDSFSAEYLVNQLVRIIQDNGGNITDISVALIINTDELTDEKVEDYRELVAYSMGISKDKIAVSSAQFIKSEESYDISQPGGEGLFTGSLKDILERIGTTGIIIFASMLILLVSVFILVRTVLKMKKKVNKIMLTGKFGASEEKRSPTAPNPRQEDMPGEIVLNETREQALKRQIKEFSSSNPETVAQLLRVWMKEEENK